MLLQKKSWTSITLKDRQKLSEDTLAYTFEVPKGKKLDMGICQYIQFGIHMKDKMLIRSYTPTRPVLDNEDDGTVELTVKTYFSNDDQPGGAFSNFLYALLISEQVDVNGPIGEIEYLGGGRFTIDSEETTFSKVSSVVEGSGLTPSYQLIAKILRTKEDKIQLRVVDANKS